MFCNQCGTQLADGSLFCSNCGTKQNAVPLEEDLDKTVGVFHSAPVTAAPQQPVYQPPKAPVYQPPQHTPYQPPKAPAYQPPQHTPYQPPKAPTYQPPQPAYQPPVTPAPQQNAKQGKAAGGDHNGKVGFGKAIKLFFANYVNFKGRASKSEYWWAFLFNFLVSTVAGFIPYVGFVIMLALFLPGLSITVRRLHDTGKPWPYLLMSLIPFAGAIIMIVYLCKDSVGDNQWGPGPVANGYNQYVAPAYTPPVAPKVITDGDIVAMAQQREPVNVNAPEAKRVMDNALATIVPSYTGLENLVGAMMLCDPQTIKQNISDSDTDTLFVIYKALGYYISKGDDTGILGMVRQNVMATLKARF